MTQNLRPLPFICVALFLSYSPSRSGAEVPRLIHYQGKLRDAGGAAVNASVAMRFRLYEDPIAGASVLFDESHGAVDVASGLFNVLIGSVNAGGVPDSALDRPEVYLGITIDGGSELAPRSRIGALAYSFKAGSAEQLVRPGTFAPEVTVAGDGNVGVGVPNPTDFKLQIAGSVGPAGDAQHDLGSSDTRWRSVYANEFSNPEAFGQFVVDFYNSFSGNQGQENINYCYSNDGASFPNMPNYSANRWQAPTQAELSKQATAGYIYTHPGTNSFREDCAFEWTVSAAEDGYQLNVEGELIASNVLCNGQGVDCYIRKNSTELARFTVTQCNQVANLLTSLGAVATGDVIVIGIYNRGDNFYDSSTFHDLRIVQAVTPSATNGLAFKTNGGTRMFITAGGNVGIGVTSTGAYKLYVTGSAYSTGTWVDGCSRELKQEICPLDAADAEAALSDLHPVRFRYRSDPGEEFLGFVAEDVPGLVAMADRRGLSPMDIVAVLTKAVQDQRSVIVGQQVRLAEQEAATAGLRDCVGELAEQVDELKTLVRRKAGNSP